jgi:hypothetical protein
VLRAIDDAMSGVGCIPFGTAHFGASVETVAELVKGKPVDTADGFHIDKGVSRLHCNRLKTAYCHTKLFALAGEFRRAFKRFFGNT